MNIPFSDDEFKSVKLSEKQTDIGILSVWAIPFWPCYEKDGAGKRMSVDLEIYLDMDGIRYQLTEMERE